MPEGDTIHRTAETLRRAIAGRTVERVTLSRHRGLVPRAGTKVVGIEARGKHLLVHFSSGLTLHTHLGMPGSWHTYAPGERWRKGRHLARAMIETPDAVAVCFQAPTVEVLPTAEIRTHPRLARLGPDLCDPDADLDDALARMDTLAPGTEIGVALLDQRVASGIGNVYKSETLFACRVDPFATVGSLDEPTRRGLLATASKLLRANLSRRGPRTTHPAGLAVYGKTRRPCPRCGAPITSRRQGEHSRTTYWCPGCQSCSAEFRRR